jgi:hypothetical protein
VHHPSYHLIPVHLLSLASDVHVVSESSALSSASSSSPSRFITPENQFLSGPPPQQETCLRRLSSDLGPDNTTSANSLKTLSGAATLFPASHHHQQHQYQAGAVAAASNKIETNGLPKYNYSEDRALQAHFPDRAGILNNHCPIESPSILPTRAVPTGTCSEDIITVMDASGRLSSSAGHHRHHHKSPLPSSSDSDPTNDAEPMSAAISRLILNNPKNFGYNDRDDDDIDLTFGIAHLNLDLNTPIAPRGSNAPWMLNDAHEFSSESRMASSWAKREELRDENSLNAFGSYSPSQYSSISPHPEWVAGHRRRHTMGMQQQLQAFLPAAASYVAEPHQSPPSFFSSRTSSDINRNTAPFGLRSLYDSGSEAELGPTPPHIIAAQQHQGQYYRYRQGSLSSGEPFFNNSPERNPGLSVYMAQGGQSYSEHGPHPHHPRTTTSGPNPSRLTNEGVYGSQVEGLYPSVNVNLNNVRPGHRSSLSQSSTTSTSRHSDSHSQKSSAHSTASSSPPQPAPNRLHGTTTTNHSNANNNNNKKARSPDNNNNKDQLDAEKKKGGKPRQDKRLYAADPHVGPRPTDWMLSEETIRSRNARDARFAQIVAMGLTKGRTKAGWAQARRPGKRDRDAAKRKLREMEEEAERDRLRALLNEGQPVSTVHPRD